MAEKKNYYITTPIYYSSGKPHLGHSYTTVCCDAIARYKRMQGFDVFYLTGADEHGQKIEKSAQEAGQEPQKFVDGLYENFKSLWSLLNISYDKFIRTTDDYHVEAVSNIFNKLYEKGEIYKSRYEGKYCSPCEAFWTESQLTDGKCPDCGREVNTTSEEAYFFKLSKYGDRIEKLLRKSDFLQPASRVNEMINNFIRPGLEDLCVSRTSFKWGIPVSFDKKHVIYVWIDALNNYITALGAFGKNESLFKKYWPCDLHVVGKEIVRFHAIIWPAILMALDIPLPKKIFGHGWLLFGEDKMSKSKGNVIDPYILCGRYGVDAVRYYLLREVPFGSDGNYTNRNFLARLNSDLTNDLSNLVSRTLAMNEQYFKSIVPEKGEEENLDRDFAENSGALYRRVDEAMDALNLPKALEEIFKVISRANKYIDETAPWKLKDSLRGQTVIYNLIETIRIAAVLLGPFLPATSEEIFRMLNLTDSQKTHESVMAFGGISGNKTEMGKLFMRKDIEKELKELGEIADNEAGKGKKEEKVKEQKEKITIDDFTKVELRTALVTSCERVEGADKLLKLTVQMGEEVRTVVSGIAKSYTPEEIVGKTVVLVANLLPVKIRGIESNGMILCADCGDKVTLVSPITETKDGEKVR